MWCELGLPGQWSQGDEHNTAAHLLDNAWWRALPAREADMVRILYVWKPLTSFKQDDPELVVDVCPWLV